MSEQKHEAPEGRAAELGREEAAEAGQGESREAAHPQDEGRMAGSRTGRFGGANEDPTEKSPGFTPEGRSNT